MRRALVLRAGEDARRTAEKLAEMGFACVLSPVLEIVATGAKAPTKDFDAIVVTSAKALEHGDQPESLRRLPLFAVGARVPHVAARIGAIATQALVNPYYGIDGLKLLREGRGPQDIIESLIAADAGRESRQLHIMDASGRIAAYTGRECVEWCGHLEGKGFSIAGNMLAGARVLDDSAETYIANEKMPFARRLIAAMRTGEAAGGDKRGKQSAALLIYGEEEWSELDLRVDDHADPLAEIERLEAVSRERWVHFRKYLPTRDNPAGVTDRGIIDAGIEAATASER